MNKYENIAKMNTITQIGIILELTLPKPNCLIAPSFVNKKRGLK